MAHTLLVRSSSRFPLSLAQDPGLICLQDLVDPGPVMGDSGEDSRGLCIQPSIGYDALGHPSTQKRAPRVSLEGEEREREEGKPRKSSTPVCQPAWSHIET